MQAAISSPAAYWRAMMSRPWQFMLQGILIALSAAFGSTMAASLFLAHAGAEGIPLYYMLFAALSIPLSVCFSTIIDRWPRRKTLGVLLALYTVGAALASLLLGDSVTPYYLLYLVISVLELLIYSVYYTLFSDYFTVIDGKRYGGAMTVALGVGAALGSLLVSLLAEITEPRRVFLALPLLTGIALLHLLWLTRREQPLDESESAAEEGLIESIKALPKVAHRYPIVLVMAAAVFFNIVGQCVMEFEAFSIYTGAYPDEAALAAFLGRMTAVIDVVGILVVFFVSNPLIPRIGVPAMGLVPPAINVLSFLILTLSSSLPAGILAHLNYYPLEHSLNVPVFALTYNAVPRRFVGRVRVNNDGIVYPLALAASGLLLLLIQNSLSLEEIALIGGAGALLYFLAQWGVGHHYVRGLVRMLQRGTVELDQIGQGFRLQEEHAKDIAAMLRAEDGDTRALGVELAARCDSALALPEFAAGLARVPAETARAALATLASRSTRPAEQRLRTLLEEPHPGLRALALESLLLARHAPDPPQLEALLAAPDETLRALAAAGLLVAAPLTPGLCDLLVGLGSTDAVLTALRVLRPAASADLLPVLDRLRAHQSPEVRAEVLTIAAGVATAGDTVRAGWADTALAETLATVRAAAAILAARVALDADLPRLCHRLFGDGEAEVRLAASLALGRRGGRALAALATQLRRHDQDVIGEVMDGIGAAGPEAADDMLYAYLAEAVFPAVARNLAVMKRMPADRPAWRSLEVAIADSNTRTVQSVLHALGVLGYKRLLGAVRAAMRAGDERTRANAVETLSSLAHRRYVLPLLPLFEAEDPAGERSLSGEEMRRLLSPLLGEEDPYIAAAATTVWIAEFASLPPVNTIRAHDLIEQTRAVLTRSGAQGSYEEEFPMNRLAFLKSVPLFSSLTLDHLMAVDAAMLREPYLPNERIIRQGDAGDKLYIVFRGEVAILKRMANGEERELARLGSGELFGEMALFDDEPRSATVVALTDAELLALDRDHFHSLAYQRPDIPIQVCKVLVSRLRTAHS